MPAPLLKRPTPDEAIAIMKGGLAQAELELAVSFTAPLFWLVRQPDRRLTARNGTAFFLDTGQRVFGVTAAHVIEGWNASRLEEDAGTLRLAGDYVHSAVIDPAARLIDTEPGIDIATFEITREEVNALGKQVLRGWPSGWPPKAPPVNCGINLNGYPGEGTRWFSEREVCFGAAPAGGVVSSISETDISMQLEREHLFPVLGRGIPPENFNFGGISGGPVLAVVEGWIRSWSLCGVIYQGPNTSLDGQQAIAGLEIIKARRAEFIQPDGVLNRARWQTVAA